MSITGLKSHLFSISSIIQKNLRSERRREAILIHDNGRLKTRKEGPRIGTWVPLVLLSVP